MVRAFQRNRQAIGKNTNPQSLYKYYNKISKKGEIRIINIFTLYEELICKLKIELKLTYGMIL